MSDDVEACRGFHLVYDNDNLSFKTDGPKAYIGSHSKRAGMYPSFVTCLD